MRLRPTPRSAPPLALDTRAVLAGRGEPVAGAPLNSPPVLASAFRAGGEHGYAREGNPTWQAFENAMGSLEGGTAVAFGTGMAAAAATIEGLPPTAHVLVTSSAYVEVRRLLAEREAAGRLRLSEVDASDTEAVLGALEDVDMVWLDSISNPGLDLAEVDLIAPAARAAGALLVVDSTLATPVNQRPLELGADVVIHSATKYTGGHSDLLLGVAVTAEPDRARRLAEARTTLGSVPGTLEAWLGLRGLRTLPLRVRRGEESATVIAERLETHPDVLSVRYPGLADDPAHGVAERLLDGFGAMLAFEVVGGEAAADAICRRVEVITHAGSFGGVESLIERQGRWHQGADVPPGLLRLSVGCEDPGDIWRDLEAALAA